jgi:hypothetical protein
MAVDQYELHAQQMREAAANAERVRAENVQVFTKMWLTLGSDVVIVADGSRHDAALAEARSLAAHRWSRLLSQEEQIIRDEAVLAGRPKQRPSQPGDDIVPDRTIQKWNAEWEDQTRLMREELVNLKQSAKNERKALEGLRVDFRRK